MDKFPSLIPFHTEQAFESRASSQISPTTSISFPLITQVPPPPITVSGGAIPRLRVRTIYMASDPASTYLLRNSFAPLPLIPQSPLLSRRRW